jgi:prevent-host-death family protein
MDVGIRELKAHLSAHLRSASEGRTITVTDRGRPIAMIVPVTGVVDLDAAARAGWLTPASDDGLRPFRARSSTTTVAQAVAEDRAE